MISIGVIRGCFKTPAETENVTCLSADRDFEWQTKGIFEGIAALSLRKLPQYAAKRWRFMAVEGF